MDDGCRIQTNILLFMDNFSGHKTPFLSNSGCHFFAPKETPFVQHLDAGIIRSLQAKYKGKLCEKVIDAIICMDRLHTVWDADMLSAMRMIRVAWSEVSLETIDNC